MQLCPQDPAETPRKTGSYGTRRHRHATGTPQTTQGPVTSKTPVLGVSRPEFRGIVATVKSLYGSSKSHVPMKVLGLSGAISLLECTEVTSRVHPTDVSGGPK